MPTPMGRALSIQEQQALELIAANVSTTAEAMWLQASAQGPVDEQQMQAAYLELITGAMTAVAGARVAYLQAFAQAEGKTPFTVPAGALAPKPEDVLVPGVRPEGAVTHVAALQRKWTADLLDEAAPKLKAAVAEGVQDAVEATARGTVDTAAEAASRARLERELQARVAQMGAARFGQLAESTVTSTADYVTRAILNPDKRVAALRRVVHPGACDRCTTVAGVLVFKRKPRLRHDQCRCSYEPVYLDDPEYQDRLNVYRMNMATTGGKYARDTRSRGRAQMAASEYRVNSQATRDAWERLLQAEEQRATNLVKTIKSNTFKDWEVMVAAGPATPGSKALPVITRI
jgi:hypothetical protein